MTTFTVNVALHSLAITPHLDKLARSNDPYLRKRLTEEVKNQVQATRPQQCRYTLSPADLNRYCRLYGEQYVADAAADLVQYFDIVNRRFFSRTVPTQLAVLYLFGSGKEYRPNNAAFSAAGEAVAGYCIEQFGYQALVRPLGIMPDAVLWTARAGQTRLALVEAKASTRTSLTSAIFENTP